MNAVWISKGLQAEYEKENEKTIKRKENPKATLCNAFLHIKPKVKMLQSFCRVYNAFIFTGNTMYL